MKITLKSLIFTLVGLLALPAMAQESQKLTATKASEYGLAYTLPQTVLDVTLEVQITRSVPGEYANYARKYLNVANPITRESSSARLLQAIITPRGVADNDNRWLAQFKGGAFAMVDGQGVLQAINTEDIVTATTVTLPQAKAAAPSPLATEAARQAITQEMIQSQSSAKRAELAAARIYELREARNDIIAGQSDQSFPDGQALQLALDNLSAQEAALTAMFIGYQEVSTQVVTMTYTPDEAGESVLCRLSATDGIVAANDLSGAPVYITMTETSRGTLPTNEKGEVKKFPKGGVAYTIPGTAHFAISYQGKTVAQATLPIAQLGVTFGLDPSIFTDKKAPSSATFDATTGAVREVKPMP